MQMIFWINSNSIQMLGKQ